MPIRAQAAGAEAFPRPASGRPRAGSGGKTVSLMWRAPREVYRVLNEDDFLAGATAGGALEPLAPRHAAPRLRRNAAVAMLTGTIIATAAALVLHSLSPSQEPARGVTAGGTAIRSPRARSARPLALAAATARAHRSASAARRDTRHGALFGAGPARDHGGSRRGRLRGWKTGRADARAATAILVASARPSASVSREQSERIEFGFEH